MEQALYFYAEVAITIMLRYDTGTEQVHRFSDLTRNYFLTGNLTPGKVVRGTVFIIIIMLQLFI